MIASYATFDIPPAPKLTAGQEKKRALTALAALTRELFLWPYRRIRR